MNRHTVEAILNWKRVLLIVCVAHAAATVQLRLVPVLGPELIMNYGWTPDMVGHVATIANVGSVGFVMIGAGVFRALGAARGILLGIASGLSGLLLVAVPGAAVPYLAGILLGFCHAPSHPIGNDLLQNHAPGGYRALIFSVKQSAPALGGVLAGLILPVIGARYGLYAALVAAAVPLLIGLMILAPLYSGLRRMDLMRPRNGAMFDFQNLSGPTYTVLSDPQLRRLTLTGFTLALVNSAWLVYLPTYLALEIGISPVVAGYIFALFQVGAFVGRLALGWIADKILSPRLVLTGALVGSAIVNCLLPVIAPSAQILPIAVLATALGVLAAGWSGVQVAEVMRLAPRDRLIDAGSGVMVTTGLGVIIGPLLFPVLMFLTGSWEGAFMAIVVFPLAALIVLTVRRPGSPT